MHTEVEDKRQDTNKTELMRCMMSENDRVDEEHVVSER